ncbi:LLM class F420-dependent oxidoreductase [Mycobacterium sp. DL440]|uniref:LLM class F420-dependent oxidoreductase n=1 Tax=Mycobacterium sp. DL440 TaxID=2675523 RepID=UPI00142347AE|nr:LLM class F420-dependent oxidoreductase [Mycobacterium sp. DL440]
MRVGVQFPNEAFVGDPVEVRDFVQTAEGLGYTHLTIYEHVLGVEHTDRNPPLVIHYDESTVFHEPLVLSSYIAAVTSSIELTTGVVVLPQRQTALVAKQVAEVVFLAGKRFRLGVGVGWNHIEYESLGMDFATRGARQEEQIEVLRRLWSEPVIDFTGRWHRIDRAGISPRPRSPIPIWIGGFSEAAFCRAARVADGFIYSLYGPEGPDGETKAGVDHLRELVAEAGRDQSDFGIELLAPLPISPGEFAELVHAWSDSGVTHMTLHLLGGAPDAGSKVAALSTYMKALS